MVWSLAGARRGYRAVNTALDLIGQTQLWLGLAGEVEGKGRSADDLAYLRDGLDFRNVLLVERPNGDFGKTLMRQFLFDAWHYVLLKWLKSSSDQRIAEIAEKSLKEVSYHLDRSRDLVIRLGDGTVESHRRMQAALDDLWPFTGELFIGDASDTAVAAAGVAPEPASLKASWDELRGRDAGGGDAEHAGRWLYAEGWQARHPHRTSRLHSL